MIENYIERDIRKNVIDDLDKKEALLIIGPRQSGKTTFLLSLQEYLKSKRKQTIFLSLEDPDIYSSLNKHPKNLLIYLPKINERVFVFIDEIQYLENPSGFIKFFVDLYNEKVKLIVSGSSAFYIDRKFKDSLVGRKRIYTLYPFSFREFLKAKKANEYLQYFDSMDFFLTGKKRKIPKSIRRDLEIFLIEYAVWGGYPRVVLAENEMEKKNLLLDLYGSFLRKDLYDAKIHYQTKFYSLLKIMASQIGSLVNANELSGTLDISKDTVANFLYVMQKAYIIKLIRPFFTNVRKELTKMPKNYFIDTGLRNSIINDFRTLPERNDKGNILENLFLSLFIRRFEDFEVNYWRSFTKSEVDFVVKSKWAFEVKVFGKKFSRKKYSYFLKNYSTIKFNMIEFSSEKNLDYFDFV